jgi:hypothetical protein
MLRGRYGYGWDQPETPVPGTTFRFGYLRARGLTSFGSDRYLASPGLDLDVEWGSGSRLPLDRWWTLGGTSFLMGSKTMGYLTPDFLVTRLGLPVRMAGPFGISIQAIPRLDYGLLAGDGDSLFRAERVQGVGLLLRTILAKFYVEGSYGLMRASLGQGWGRSEGAFSVLVGTQPFDLWSRR